MLTAVGNVRRPSPDTEIVRLSFDVVNEATSPRSTHRGSRRLVHYGISELRGGNNLKAARSPERGGCSDISVRGVQHSGWILFFVGS